MCIDKKSNISIDSTEIINMNDENMNDQEINHEINDLKIAKIGGSLIDHAPLFSTNGEILYLIWGNVIKMFSVLTGEWIRDLEGNTDGNIIGLHLDVDSNLLVACTNNGTFVFWKTESYVVSHKIKAKVRGSINSVLHFSPSLIEDTVYGVLCWNTSNKSVLQHGIFDLTKGEEEQSHPICLTSSPVILKDGGKLFSYLALVQDDLLYVLDKKSKSFVTHKSRETFTALCCHPDEEIIATGDIQGKIFLWRKIYDKYPFKTELHWHAMSVRSLAFSLSGSILWSGGNEFVLVKWTLGKQVIPNFLPRFSGSLMHIAVDPKNDKLAISTDDNGVQILSSQFTQSAVIQNFTRVPSYYDFSDQSPFPAGIRINPRNNNLIMNGRIGYLQFFSTYSQRMLYNLDISLKNIAPREPSKVLYNTRITKVALSLDWMATVENWNDNENSPEVRLKFWEFLPEKQTYSLNTSVEMPHQIGVNAFEFSSKFSSANLICASAGQDKCIKVWALEEQIDEHRKRYFWMCFEKICYKDLPVLSIAFSQDGSLLSTSFGNVLCVWDTTSFKSKCVLSAPACLDGSVNQVVIALPQKAQNPTTNENLKTYMEKRKKMLEQVKLLVENGNSSLLKNITQEKTRFVKKDLKKLELPRDLSAQEKKLVFQRVLNCRDLNFHQKIQMMQKLNISCKLSDKLEEELCEYFKGSKIQINALKNEFPYKLKHFKESDQFKIRRKFKNYQLGCKTQDSVPLKKILNFSSDFSQVNKSVKVKKSKQSKQQINKEKKEIVLQKSKGLPIKNLTSITNVLFCTDEFSHLVIVTTHSRLLIWNLLTLKLQSAFKLSAKHICIDPLTNLIAAFSESNELFVFLPNLSMPIYHRKNMPTIYGAIWVPRKYPKAQSVTLNWQATSQLYFLNEQQELSHLLSDIDDEVSGPIAYFDDFTEAVPNTPFAAILAKETIKGKAIARTGGWAGNKIGVAGSQGVRELINLPTHTMPPMNLLTKDFLRSLLVVETSKKSVKPKNPDTEEDRIQETIYSDDEDTEETDASSTNQKINDRRKKMKSIEKNLHNGNAKKTLEDFDEKLNNLSVDMKLVKLFEI